MQIKHLCAIGLLACFIVVGCKVKRVTYTPKGYDITKPDITELGNKMNEISGIFWVNDNLMLAQNDESGKIFLLNLKDKKDFDYRPFQFGDKNDYEDIVNIGSIVYLLISPGQIVEVPSYAQGDVQGKIIATLGGSENEFETMYYDKAVNSLVMLCKKCHKEKNQVRTAFRYDLATKTLIDTPYYTIDVEQIRKKLKDKNVNFYPSAAAIHPIQNKLYILSSQDDKLLVITDTKGNVEQAFSLSSTLFNQPEGITFARNGDMYISNEVGTEDRATLLKFVYKP